jgi:hypothetical protein
MKSVIWSDNLQPTVRNTKREATSESASKSRKLSLQERQGVSRAFGKLSANRNEEKIFEEWV